MYDGPDADDPLAATAWTRMAMVDMAVNRPRRLSGSEREFLGRWDGAR